MNRVSTTAYSRDNPPSWLQPYKLIVAVLEADEIPHLKPGEISLKCSFRAWFLVRNLPPTSPPHGLGSRLGCLIGTLVVNLKRYQGIGK